MMLVVDEEIFLGDAVAELDDFEFEPVEADALVAILAEDERFAVFELDHVLAARIFLGECLPGAVVEDVAVLEDLDVGGALVRGRFFQRFLEVLLKDVDGAGDEGGFGSDGQRKGLKGRSAVPKGVDFVFLPISDVGENWPLVRP